MKPLLSYIDHKQCYTYCNRAYRDYFSLPENNILGQSVECVLGLKNYAALVDYLPIVFDAGKEVSYRRTAYTQDNQEKRMQVTLTPHFNQSGDIIGSSAYSLDVTQQTSNLSDLALLTQTLPNILKHELNQPLSIAQLYLQGCLAQLDHNIPDKTSVKNALSKSLQQIERISQIIHSMSALAADASLPLQPTPISHLIESVLEQCAYSLAASKIRIVHSHVTDSLNLNINRVLFSQALVNILSNAMAILHRHETPSPRIEIISRTTEQQETSIIIQNNGPSIPTDHVPLLFQLGCSGRQKGTGLGLWIASTILRLHQGELNLLANEDGHVAFEVIL